MENWISERKPRLHEIHDNSGVFLTTEKHQSTTQRRRFNDGKWRVADIWNEPLNEDSVIALMPLPKAFIELNFNLK